MLSRTCLVLSYKLFDCNLINYCRPTNPYGIVSCLLLIQKLLVRAPCALLIWYFLRPYSILIFLHYYEREMMS